MPKIQGKQIADGTILQRNLGLVTPQSTDLLSAATVQYVNSAITNLSAFTGIIGTPSDGTYTDGLFTFFNSGTTIANAVDDFNEVLLKLAPTPPSPLSASGPMSITSTTYSARALTTGTAVSSIVVTTTPVFTVPAKSPNGIGDATSGTLSFDVNGSNQETDTMTGVFGTKNTGVLRYTIGDPYAGVSGKQYFWTGITSSIVANSTALTAGASLQTAHLTHSTTGQLSASLYVDSPSSPSVGAITATPPAMSNHISGVPSFNAGDTITGINFNITNAVSYFYNNAMFDITGSLINTADWRLA